MTDQQTNPTQPEKAIIYARKASRSPQTGTTAQYDSLMTFATEQGYTNVALFSDSSLATLLDQLRADGERITTFIVASVDRLFRGEQMVSVSAFIALCRQRGILIVTPDMRYDFTDPADVELFRFQCEDAYQFITQMVVTRLQQGKRAARLKRLQAPEPPPYTGAWKYPGRKTEKSEGN